MGPIDTSTPATIHTLKTLCDELVSGRAVSVDDGKRTFICGSAETRSIFNWYRANQPKWAGNVQKPDVESIVDEMAKPPPVMPPVGAASPSRKKTVLHLKSLKAHRFAGIHPFGSLTDSPADFCFDFQTPLTLIEGNNGAGKTSILNAITWCLTGCIYRPQRPPERADQPVSIGFAKDDCDGEEEAFDMTPITPMPPATVLESLSGDDLLLDTWVELSFVDESGSNVGTVRRSIGRTNRGKLTVTASDPSTLGLAPIALEVGTRLPGLIPYIHCGTPCDLGKSVSTLTGIRPLEDLVRHAQRVKTKLTKDLVGDREEEIGGIDAEFTRLRSELDAIVREHPGLGPPTAIPASLADTGVEAVIEANVKHFQELQSRILRGSRTILGESFDPGDSTACRDLTDSIGPALGLVEPSEIRKLPSAGRLAALGTSGEEELGKAEQLISSLRKQADELSQLEQEPDVATRLRLYARVASWMKTLPSIPEHVRECPLCLSDLQSRTDPITGRAVAEHLSRYLRIDCEFLERTIESWGRSASAELTKDLPGPIRAELSQDLPRLPADLIFKALTDELFQSRFFQGALKPLQDAAVQVCSQAVADLPAFVEPRPRALPDSIGKHPSGSNLDRELLRAERAIAFARWRRNAAEACKTVFDKVVGRAAAGGPPGPSAAGAATIAERLEAIDQTVRNAQPLTDLLGKLDLIKRNLASRRKKEQRIKLYAGAAHAITPLCGLGELVEKQVSSLVKKLSSRTVWWKQRCYAPAYAGAPQATKADVTADGGLHITAVVEGTRAPAAHVSNASDLRASLLAFLLAFWEHIVESQGGLSLLLLDDFHELFDQHNRRRLANCLPQICAAGGRLIVTTNDHRFAQAAITAMSKAQESDKVDHRRVHPLNPQRDHVELVCFREEIDRKRAFFELADNVNEDQPGRDYVKDLRIYLEAQLLDLLEVPDRNIPQHPTLSDLIQAIRRRARAGHSPFAGPVCRALLSDPAMRDNSRFLEIMNTSHHGQENSITYTDVCEVKDDCIRIRKLVDSMHEEYELWMRRDPADAPILMPTVPDIVLWPTFNVPMMRDIAAFTSDSVLGDPLDVDERLTQELLENCTAYSLNTHNLGFAGARCSRVLASTLADDVPDNSLVIALNGPKVYARRLFKSLSSGGMLALGSDAQNPLKRPPTLFLPAHETRLLQIVGILFSDSPVYAKNSDEAVLADATGLIKEVQMAFRVKGDSAIPLALPEQVILGGDLLTPAQMHSCKGCVVAIATTDGAALKRIGQTVAGLPNVRLFESIGGLGDSMLVRMEELDDDTAQLPVLLSARRIIGVLYKIPGLF